MEHLRKDAQAAVIAVPRELAWGKSAVVAKGDHGWHASVSFSLQPSLNHTFDEFAECVVLLRETLCSAAALLQQASCGSTSIAHTIMNSTFSVRVKKASAHLDPLPVDAIEVLCSEVLVKLVSVWCAQLVRTTMKTAGVVVAHMQSRGYPYNHSLMAHRIEELSDICVSCSQYCSDGVRFLPDVCNKAHAFALRLEAIRSQLRTLAPCSVVAPQQAKRQCISIEFISDDVEFN